MYINAHWHTVTHTYTHAYCLITTHDETGVKHQNCLNSLATSHVEKCSHWYCWDNRQHTTKHGMCRIDKLTQGNNRHITTGSIYHTCMKIETTELGNYDSINS